MIENKKRPKPAPGAYKFKEYVGKEGGPTSSKTTNSCAEKICGFIEEAKWQSHQAPGTKYQKSFKIPDKNPKQAVMWKENEKSKDRRLDKIVRDKSKPAPGEYNTYDAWKKS